MAERFHRPSPTRPSVGYCSSSQTKGGGKVRALQMDVATNDG